MANTKKRTNKLGVPLCLFIAVLFACQKVPEYYCGKGALYDPKTEGCLEKGSDEVGMRCPNDSIVPFGAPCPVVTPPPDTAKPPVDSTKKQFAVKVSSAGTGATGGGNYAKGDTVKITAGTAPTGRQFKNWTSADSVVFADSSKNATTFIMPAKAVTVTAVFETTQVVPPPPDLDYGTLADSDGRKYRTIKIGRQTWMAENYNYEELTGSWCYKNSADSCEKYGRLYDWETARGVCPSGWRLPTGPEWDTLTAYAGGELAAGKKLKSATGWKSDGGIAATNELGFSALPGGYRAVGDRDLFLDVGEKGYWWTRTPSDRDRDSPYGWVMTYDYDGANKNGYDKKRALSVRCIKPD